jgi:hypothetical protein
MTTFLGGNSRDVCEWDTKPSATDPWGEGAEFLGLKLDQKETKVTKVKRNSSLFPRRTSQRFGSFLGVDIRVQR